MALVIIKPTRIDTAIADAIAAHTDGDVEDAAEALTWGADEHVLLALAAASWLYVQLRKPQQAPLANHILTVSLVTAVLPHILKSAFDQTQTGPAHNCRASHGVPVCGRARDAFPSGHAVPMGALASAAGLLPPVRRREVRSIAVALSLTRITLLAHWASDVVAGYALGAAASLDIDKTAGALELKRSDGNGELAVRGLLYGELDLLGCLHIPHRDRNLAAALQGSLLVAGRGRHDLLAEKIERLVVVQARLGSGVTGGEFNQRIAMIVRDVIEHGFSRFGGVTFGLCVAAG